MAILADLKKNILGLLQEGIDDTGEIKGTGGTTSDMLVDAVSAALDAITIRCYKASIVEVVASATYIDLPEDFIEVEGVLDNETGELLPKTQFIAGEAMLGANAWHHFPYNTVTFLSPVGEDGAQIFYSALWDKPSLDVDVLVFPMFAVTAVEYFAAAHLMIGKANKSAETRQWGTKVDSGTPVNLPHKDMAFAMMRLHEDAMNRMPMMAKGSF